MTTFQAPPDNNTLKSRPPARTTYQPRPNANTLANKRHKQRVPAVDTTWNPYKKDWVAKSTASKPAEAEAFSTPGVEGQDPLDPILPPELPETPKPKRRRSRKQKSRHIRQNDKKAKATDGGARKVKVRGVEKPASAGVNGRTCLADAVAALLSQDAEAAYAAMIEAMPAEGDTSPEHLTEALAAHGLTLERASKNFFLAGGPRSFHLLQETECKLVLHLNLVDFEDEKHSHFVAWDGQTIHDSPHSLKIYKNDRRSNEASKEAFGKLYDECRQHEITTVYRLKDL